MRVGCGVSYARTNCASPIGYLRSTSVLIMEKGDGEANGKITIFDDMLAFMWCKIEICPCGTLLNVVKTFYKAPDIAKSRNLLFRRIPDSSERRVKHRKAEDILRGIYELFQGLPTEDPPVFVATDLNNIPYIDLSNVDGAMLVSQQRAMKDNITAILTDQERMREQLSRIQSLLETNNPAITNEESRSPEGMLTPQH